MGQNTELKTLEDFTVFMVARRKPANTLLWGTEKVAAHAVAVSRISELLKSIPKVAPSGCVDFTRPFDNASASSMARNLSGFCQQGLLSDC